MFESEFSIFFYSFRPIWTSNEIYNAMLLYLTIKYHRQITNWTLLGHNSRHVVSYPTLSHRIIRRLLWMWRTGYSIFYISYQSNMLVNLCTKSKKSHLTNNKIFRDFTKCGKLMALLEFKVWTLFFFFSKFCIEVCFVWFFFRFTCKIF